MLKRLGSRGDTIMEVLISLAILSFVLAASFSLANRSTQATRQANERSEASKYAQAQVELLKQYLSTVNTNSGISQYFCLDDNASLVTIPGTVTANIDANYNQVRSTCGHGIDQRYVTIIEKKSGANNYQNNTYLIYTRWDSAIGGGTDRIDLVHHVYPSASKNPDIYSLVYRINDA